MLPTLNPSDDTIRLIACPRPFSVERIDRTMPAGLTIAELLEETLDPGLAGSTGQYVFVGDRMVPETWYGRVKPRPGQTVTIRIVPGDSGGGGQKDPFRTVLTIAVIAAAAYVSGGALTPYLGSSFAAGSVGAGIAAAAVPVAGALLVNAAAPPPRGERTP